MVVSGTVIEQTGDGNVKVRTQAGEVSLKTPTPLPQDRQVTLQIPPGNPPMKALVFMVGPPLPQATAPPVAAAAAVPAPPPQVTASNPPPPTGAPAPAVAPHVAARCAGSGGHGDPGDRRVHQPSSGPAGPGRTAAAPAPLALRQLPVPPAPSASAGQSGASRPRPLRHRRPSTDRQSQGTLRPRSHAARPASAPPAPAPRTGTAVTPAGQDTASRSGTACTARAAPVQAPPAPAPPAPAAPPARSGSSRQHPLRLRLRLSPPLSRCRLSSRETLSRCASWRCRRSRQRSRAGPASQPQPSPAGTGTAATPPAASSPPTLAATVAGTTSAGQPIVTTDRGVMVLNTRTPLAPGTQVTIGLPPVRPAPAEPFDPLRGQDWPALRETLEVLAKADPAGHPHPGERDPAPGQWATGRHPDGLHQRRQEGRCPRVAGREDDEGAGSAWPDGSAGKAGGRFQAACPSGGGSPAG